MFIGNNETKELLGRPSIETLYYEMIETQWKTMGGKTKLYKNDNINLSKAIFWDKVNAIYTKSIYDIPNGKTIYIRRDRKEIRQDRSNNDRYNQVRTVISDLNAMIRGLENE